MADLIIPTFDRLLGIAQKLMADLPEERMTAQPVAGVVINHPAWIIGHLAWANNNGIVLLGGETAIPPQFKDLFATGTKPAAERSTYPTKAELMATLESSHRRLADAWQHASPEALSNPAPERMRAAFATLGSMLAGLMTGHFGSHLGQLSAWRRAMGMPSAF